MQVHELLDFVDTSKRAEAATNFLASRLLMYKVLQDEAFQKEGEDEHDRIVRINTAMQERAASISDEHLELIHDEARAMMCAILSTLDVEITGDIPKPKIPTG